MEKIFSTKTKLYTNRMKGSPELNWEWGSLNRVLTSVLTEGFTLDEPVKSFIYLRDERQLKLMVDNPEGFEVNTVIKLSGHSDPRINKEFRIYSVGYNYIIVNAPEDLTGVSSSALKINVPSLGWEVAHSSGNTVAYKNKQEEHPCVIKVVDEAPPRDYGASWARFARVTGGKKLNPSDGTFVLGQNFPNDPVMPNRWLVGDEKAGAAGVHGWTRWYYCTHNNSTSVRDDTSIDNIKGNYPTDWFIVGDKDTFYIGIKIQGNNADYYSIYGFGLYEDYGTGREPFLICSEESSRANSGRGGNHISPGNSLCVSGWENPVGQFVFTNANGVWEKNSIKVTQFGVNSHGNIGGEMQYQPSVGSLAFHPLTGKVFCSPLYLRQTGTPSVIRGKYRGIMFPVGYNLSLNNGFVQDCVVFNIARWASTTTLNTFFPLTDWE